MALPIAHETWESHKSILKLLYKHKTLKEIKEYMVKNHSFNATTNQYQAKFKTWGSAFRKNMTDKEWSALDYKINKRTKNQRQCVVFRNGKKMTQKLVQKEISRHVRLASYATTLLNAASPETPEGIEIFSPSNAACLEIDTETLPWFQFQDHLSSHVQKDLSQLRNLPLDIEILGISDRPYLNTSEHRTQIEPLPVTIESMNTMMIERYDGEFLSLTVSAIQNGPKDTAVLQFFKHLVYLSSNNLLDKKAVGRMLDKICSIEGQFEVLLEFLSAKILSIEAFAEKLFESAVYLKNILVIERLLLLKPWISTRSLISYQLDFAVLKDRNSSEVFRYANANPHEAVCYAIRQGDLDLLIKLLSKFALQGNDFLQNAALSECLALSPSSGFYSSQNRDTRLSMCKILIEKEIQSVYGSYCYCKLPSEIHSRLQEVEYLLTNKKLTVVEAAVISDDANLVQYILNWGSTVGLADSLLANSNRALFYAIANGSNDLISILVGHGADINAIADIFIYGRVSALYFAARYGNEEVVRFLVDLGADVNTSAELRSPIRGAVQSRNVSKVKILLAKGADIRTGLNYYNQYEPQKTEMNQFILDFCIDLGTLKGQTLLPLSLSALRWDFARTLVENGAQINADVVKNIWNTARTSSDIRDGESFVHWIFQHGKFLQKKVLSLILYMYCTEVATDLIDDNFIRSLVNYGADVNFHPKGKAPLLRQEVAGRSFRAFLLLDLGADPNLPLRCGPSHGESVLCWAATGELKDPHNRKLLILERLLNSGAQPNPPFECDEYPLSGAINGGDYTAAKLLIDAGANINAPAPPFHIFSRIALQSACEVSSETDQFVEYLLENGAEVNAPAGKRRGATALQIAAMNGQLGRAVRLLKAGADVNAPRGKFHGRTALEGAAEHGRLDMVQLLLDQGCDTNPLALKTAYELARKEGHLTTSRLLESKFGDVSPEDISNDMQNEWDNPSCDGKPLCDCYDSDYDEEHCYDSDYDEEHCFDNDSIFSESDEENTTLYSNCDASYQNYHDEQNSDTSIQIDDAEIPILCAVCDSTGEQCELCRNEPL